MNFYHSENINALWGNLIVEELVRNGIDYFCLASGSRSSPLTMAVAKHKKTQSFIHFDERAAAFHALGYTAATKKTAALICTSGTAGANFLPAVIECSKKKLPLIILTADRPPELRQTGANQTIDQVNIFGKYIRFHVDLPCPTKEIPSAFVLTTIDQAVYRTQGVPQGPVHINCMFREPLAPIKSNDTFKNYLKPLIEWIKTSKPYTRYAPFTKTLNESELKTIAQTINQIKQGIIAVGKMSSQEEREGVLKLAKRLNWPIFPDISSGLRMGNTDKSVIHYYDQLLLSKSIINSFKIDGVLHLGGRITSKRFEQLLEATSPKHYITVLNHPLRNDPLHKVTLRVESSIDSFCKKISPLLSKRTNSKLTTTLNKASNKAKEQITTFLNNDSLLSEPFVARCLSKLIPQNSGLFVANSMPIRDMDMYACEDKSSVIFGANRGASGIDGTIATACGFAKGLNKTTTLLLGDLAFLHDLNSLAMIRHLNKPFIIVVLNNNGGGIFSFLPIAQSNKYFEQYFGTPHNCSFEHAAGLFHLAYKQPMDQNTFSKEYQLALKNKKATLIEVAINRKKNYDFHQKLQKAVMNGLVKI